MSPSAPRGEGLHEVQCYRAQALTSNVQCPAGKAKTQGADLSCTPTALLGVRNDVRYLGKREGPAVLHCAGLISSSDLERPDLSCRSARACRGTNTSFTPHTQIWRY